VDLLVDMAPHRSLLDVVGLGQDLEELAEPQAGCSPNVSVERGDESTRNVRTIEPRRT